MKTITTSITGDTSWETTSAQKSKAERAKPYLQKSPWAIFGKEELR